MATPWTQESLLKIGGKTFKLRDLMGRYVYAAKSLPLLRSLFNRAIVYTVKPGEGIGTVYSFLSQDGTNYLVFLDANQKSYYVPIGDDDLQLNSVLSQGVSPLPTPEQIAAYQEQQRAANKETSFLGMTQQVLTLGILVAAGAYIFINKGKK